MKYRYVLSSAPSAPETAPILLQGSIVDCLHAAQRYGYDGIEIHLRDDQELDLSAIRQTMQETGTHISQLVTGKLFTERGLSLLRPETRDDAILGLKRYLDLASELQAGIVLGWARGRLDPAKDKEPQLQSLQAALGELDRHAERRGVKINLEVINRYEINVFNRADETLAFIREGGFRALRVHLDTFHMNIEEDSLESALRLAGDNLGYVHFADNQRRFPGSGSLSFNSILDTLDELNYRGDIGIECLPWPSAEQAILKSRAVLR